MRKSSNVSGNFGAGSAAKTISTGRGLDSPPADVPANTAESGNDLPPLGFGGNFGGHRSDGTFDLLDINGDGLPDRVSQGTSSTASSLMDMNGDGLLDRVFDQGHVKITQSP